MKKYRILSIILAIVLLMTSVKMDWWERADALTSQETSAVTEASAASEAITLDASIADAEQSASDIDGAEQGEAADQNADAADSALTITEAAGEENTMDAETSQQEETVNTQDSSQADDESSASSFDENTANASTEENTDSENTDSSSQESAEIASPQDSEAASENEEAALTWQTLTVEAETAALQDEWNNPTEPVTWMNNLWQWLFARDAETETFTDSKWKLFRKNKLAPVTLTISGYLPEGVTAEASYIQFAEPDIYSETALLDFDLALYDAEGNPYIPKTDKPFTIQIDGKIVKAAIEDEKTFLVYAQTQETRKEEDLPKDEFTASMLVYRASIDEEVYRNYEVDQPEDNVLFTEVRYTDIEQQKNDEPIPFTKDDEKKGTLTTQEDQQTKEQSVIFEAGTLPLRFVLSAQQAERSIETTTDDGQTEVSVQGALSEKMTVEAESVDTIENVAANTTKKASTANIPGIAADQETIGAWDISLNHKEEGVCQPDAPVTVTITDNAIESALKAGAELTVWNIPEEGNPEKVEDVEFRGSSVTFETQTLPVYMITKTVLEKTILASDGTTYHVTVSYDESTGIPADAELEVREIQDDTREYTRYLRKSARALDTAKDSLNARIFDIKIVSKEDAAVEYQPEQPVDVSITLVGDEGVSNAQIVHFGKTTEVLDGNVDKAEDGSRVEFETGSFSVFAVAYTVDFHWGDYTYNLQGGSTLLLSELLSILAQNGEQSVASGEEENDFQGEVYRYSSSNGNATVYASIKLGELAENLDRIEKVEFSNPALLIVEKVGYDWLLTNLQAFDTEEKLTIKLTNGEEIVVRVTDARSVSVNVPVTKVITSNKNLSEASTALSDETFKFHVELTENPDNGAAFEDSSDVEIPASIVLSEGTVSGTSVSYTKDDVWKVTFTKAGMYAVTVSEVDSNGTGMTYATNHAELEYKVVEEEGVLRISSVYRDNSASSPVSTRTDTTLDEINKTDLFYVSKATQAGGWNNPQEVKNVTTSGNSIVLNVAANSAIVSTTNFTIDFSRSFSVSGKIQYPTLEGIAIALHDGKNKNAYYSERNHGFDNVGSRTKLMTYADLKDGYSVVNTDVSKGFLFVVMTKYNNNRGYYSYKIDGTNRIPFDATSGLKQNDGTAIRPNYKFNYEKFSGLNSGVLTDFSMTFVCNDPSTGTGTLTLVLNPSTNSSENKTIVYENFVASNILGGAWKEAYFSFAGCCEAGVTTSLNFAPPQYNEAVGSVDTSFWADRDDDGAFETQVNTEDSFAVPGEEILVRHKITRADNLAYPYEESVLVRHLKDSDGNLISGIDPVSYYINGSGAISGTTSASDVNTKSFNSDSLSDAMRVKLFPASYGATWLEYKITAPSANNKIVDEIALVGQPPFVNIQTQAYGFKTEADLSQQASFTNTVTFHTVTYNPNGGTFSDNTTANKTVSSLSGSTFTVSETPTRSGYAFAGWKLSSDSTTYAVGDTFTLSGDVTLTAQWTEPLAVDVHIMQLNSDGTLTNKDDEWRTTNHTVTLNGSMTEADLRTAAKEFIRDDADYKNGSVSVNIKTNATSFFLYGVTGSRTVDITASLNVSSNNILIDNDSDKALTTRDVYLVVAKGLRLDAYKTDDGIEWTAITGGRGEYWEDYFAGGMGDNSQSLVKESNYLGPVVTTHEQKLNYNHDGYAYGYAVLASDSSVIVDSVKTIAISSGYDSSIGATVYTYKWQYKEVGSSDFVDLPENDYIILRYNPFPVKVPIYWVFIEGDSMVKIPAGDMNWYGGSQQLPDEAEVTDTHPYVLAKQGSDLDTTHWVMPYLGMAYSPDTDTYPYPIYKNDGTPDGDWHAKYKFSYFAVDEKNLDDASKLTHKYADSNAMYLQVTTSGVKFANNAAFQDALTSYSLGLYVVYEGAPESDYVCKITYSDGSGGRTFYKVYTTLAKAFNAVNTASALADKRDIKIEMLVPSYTLDAGVTLNSGKTVTLTTASAQDTKYPGPGATCTIYRGYDGGSLITSNHALTLTDIALDGNRLADGNTGFAGNTDGGLIHVASGTLDIQAGATLQNAKTSENGGAIFADGNSSIIMTGGTISNCEADKFGGGIYHSGTGDLDMSGGEIKECRGNSATGYQSEGGGIWKANGKLYIHGDAVIRDCFAEHGGGVMIRTDAEIYENAKIENCISSGWGGGLFVRENGDGIAYNSRIYGNVTIKDCKAGWNEATSQVGGLTDYRKDAMGGGLNVGYGAKLEISGDVRMTGCKAVNGGGINVEGDATSCTIKDSAAISDCTANNHGGGVYLNAGSFIMEGGTISENTGTNEGGAIYTAGTSSLTLKDGALIDDNHAARGGGVLIGWDSTFSMQGGTIRNNTATEFGGGIVQWSTTAATMSGGSITGNKADGTNGRGGAIFIINGDRFDITGGSITGNSSTVGGAVDFDNTGSRLYLSGDVTIYDNTNGGTQKNIYLSQDSSAIINTTAVGLGADANIGVYVSGDEADANSIYGRHGGEGDPFGTRDGDANVDNLSHFINDINGLIGIKGEGNNIVWLPSIKAYVSVYLGNDLDKDFIENQLGIVDVGSGWGAVGVVTIPPEYFIGKTKDVYTSQAALVTSDADWDKILGYDVNGDKIDNITGYLEQIDKSLLTVNQNNKIEDFLGSVVRGYTHPASISNLFYYGPYWTNGFVGEGNGTTIQHHMDLAFKKAQVQYKYGNNQVTDEAGQDGKDIEARNYFLNATIDLPTNLPIATGYSVAGFYRDADFTQPWNGKVDQENLPIYVKLNSTAAYIKLENRCTPDLYFRLYVDGGDYNSKLKKKGSSEQSDIKVTGTDTHGKSYYQWKIDGFVVKNDKVTTDSEFIYLPDAAGLPYKVEIWTVGDDGKPGTLIANLSDKYLQMNAAAGTDELSGTLVAGPKYNIPLGDDGKVASGYTYDKDAEGTCYNQALGTRTNYKLVSIADLTRSVTIVKNLNDTYPGAEDTFAFEVAVNGRKDQIKSDEKSFDLLIDADYSEYASKTIEVPVGAEMTITETTDGPYITAMTGNGSSSASDGSTARSFTLTVPNADTTVTFTNTRAICKIVDGGTEHLFATLRDAVTYAESMANKTATIQMLVDYIMPSTDTVAINRNDNITFTTSSATSGVYRFTESATGKEEADKGRAILKRGFEGGSLFKLSSGAKLTFANITLDGNKDVYISQENGGLVYVFSGNAATYSTLTILGGTTMRNTKSTSAGGAINASSDYSKVVITNDSDRDISFIGCVAGCEGGAISAKDITISNSGNGSIVFDDCHTGVEKKSGMGTQGGALNITGNATIAGAKNNPIVITNCSAVGDGGGIYASNNGSFVSISNVNFGSLDSKGETISDKACYSSESYGGGICINAKSATMIDCNFYGCYARGTNANYSFGGGGIYGKNSQGLVEVKTTEAGTSTFKDCSAYCGGGLFAQNIKVQGNVTFHNCSATVANKGKGGGVYASGTSSIVGATVTDCQSEGDGGGIFQSGGTLTLEGITVAGNKAKNGGGGIYVNYGALTVEDTSVTGNEAANGGGVYVAPGAAMNLQNHVKADEEGNETVIVQDSEINGNTATGNGAGIYLAGISSNKRATLNLSGNPNFGGTDLYAATSQDHEKDDIKGTDGNFKTGALTVNANNPDATKNGGKNYIRVRQDIFIAGYASRAAESIVVTGDLTGEPGTIWVWAEQKDHYDMLTQFATIDSNVTALSDNSYKVFRNARPDSDTGCGGEYLTGQTGEDPTYIYWTGGFDFSFLKIDGNDTALDGATFTLYTEYTDTTKNVYKKGGTEVTATSADGTDRYKDSEGNTLEKGTVLFTKVAPKTYYMVETTTPDEFRNEETVYQVIVNSEGTPTIMRKDDSGAYTVEAYSKTIAGEKQYRIMNTIDKYHKVILKKVGNGSSPLSGAHFRIFRADLTEVIEGQEPGKTYYESYDSGVYFIGNLPLGKYYLVETEAPGGYDGTGGGKNNTGSVFELTVDASGGNDPGAAKTTIDVSDDSKVIEYLRTWVSTQ